jgi:hypothetical protein
MFTWDCLELSRLFPWVLSFFTPVFLVPFVFGTLGLVVDAIWGDGDD